MIKTLFILLFLYSFLFAKPFDYDDISSNFNEKYEKSILKELDIDPDFIYDKRYNDLKNDLKKIDILEFKKSIKKHPKIFFTLEDLIKRSKVPDLFLYMAMVESKFLVSAKSNKNAAGLWQIVPNTAKTLHLKIDKNIDERLDPIKSTKAAIKYLQYLHERFKKWYLVALAYNCGESRLSKAIKKVEGDNIFLLLDYKKDLLPKETQDYIRRLIVSSLIANSTPIKETIKSYKKEGILKKINIKNKISIKKIAKDLNISSNELRKYNAHILDGIIEKDMQIYIPKNSNYFAKKIIKYRLKKDATLFALSKQLDIPMKKLKKLNPHTKLFIHANISINIPYLSNKDTKKLIFKKIDKDYYKTKDNNTTFIYKSKKGDTLFTISLKFNNKISTIKRLNPNLGYDIPPDTNITLMR